MKTAYFDCFSGVSGDKILGALIDLGIDINELTEELNKLNLENFSLSEKKVLKKSISALQIKVKYSSNITRGLKDIVKIINSSNLNDSIKKKSLKIFQLIAEAEAKIHNKNINQIHFHEVGAVDSIIDIVGSIICLDILKFDRIYSSKISVGKGLIKCQHGLLPVPAPATLEILKDIPVLFTNINTEISTPTGVAIMKEIVDKFTDVFDLNIIKTGYGSGEKDLEIPNILRVITGITKEIYEKDICYLLETNIDDLNPEIFPYINKKLYEAGAIEVYLTPLIMKNSRPGNKLSVIAYKENLDKIYSVIFQETSSIGLRISELKRKKLKREIKKIKTKYGFISIKESTVDNKVINYKPEHKDCVKISEKNNIPLKFVYNEAIKSYLLNH